MAHAKRRTGSISARGLGALCAALVLMFSATTLPASGPRYVTGPPFFTGRAGLPVGWRQANLLYYTDPGALSASVSHGAADALVARAAGVWNVPVASITIAQGGVLAEHVSGGNVYLDAMGMVFPDDVQSSNAAAVPIAVIYDTDGSVTDTLLGAGASDPSGCRQSSVTESVDSFDPAGYILHALIVLNGRCTGAAPELQLQLQYDLMRAFGRVLGLAWSQTNDNVFTGVPTPTYNQALHWPILHPIDILCSLYSYQCLPNPFSLRPDDVSSMVGVYPIAQNAVLALGKQPSLQYAHSADGNVSFPTGEGMAGVNMLVRRRPAYQSERDAWVETSAVTGTNFNRNGSSPFSPSAPSAPLSFGTTDQNMLGRYFIAYIPLSDPQNWQSLIASTEAVNPLYTGSYSLGPYALGNVTPAGSPPMAETAAVVGAFGDAPLYFAIADAPATCGQGADGTAAVPVQASASGWWNGLLCGYGHASYTRADTRPGRSFTVEVTALDEQGFATQGKAMPVIGLFAPTDGLKDGPSMGVAASAFQSAEFATTTLTAQTGSLTGVRIGVADERGDGRPDFAYQTRFFYADDLAPAVMPLRGGRMTITGMGFRVGNAVQVNGLDVPVVSWSANTIVVNMPVMAAAQAADNVALDVTVLDRETGASSTMTGAFRYAATSAAPGLMHTLTAPAGTLLVGDAVAVPFAVQVLAADGVTPAVGEKVVFSATVGAAGQAAAQTSGRGGAKLRAEALTGPVQFLACGAPSCTVETDAHGIAASGLTPQSTGLIKLQAMDGTLLQQASVTSVPQTSSMQLLQAPSGEIKVGQVADARFIVRDFGPDGSTGLPGRLITFSVPLGSASFEGCFTSVCSVVTNVDGVAAVSVKPTAAGPVTLQATDGDVKQSASFAALDDTDMIKILSSPGASSFVNEGLGSFIIQLLHKDGVTVDRYQYVLFTGPPEVYFNACGTNVCQMLTDTDGKAGTSVIPRKTGTFTVQVAYGSVVQQATLKVTERTMQLRILSAPSGNVPVGTTAPVTFSAQLIGLDQVTPERGATMTLAGPQDRIVLNACNDGSCTFNTDDNGVVSTTVTVLKPGLISLNANYLNLVKTATFTAVGQSLTMRILTQPPATGTYVQDLETFAVQMFEADGVTPSRGRNVTFQFTNGVFAFAGCQFASCGVQTDDNGIASIQGVPQVGGTISVQATYQQITQTMSFSAMQRRYSMRVVSTPPSGIFRREQDAGVFAVRIVGADGVSPVSGQNVTFSVADQRARFGGCADPACAVVTDAQGMASISVIALVTGTISLFASDNDLMQTATFSVAPNADPMRLVSAPSASIVAGSRASTAFAVEVLQGDGLTPAAGVPVLFSQIGRGAGAIAFEPCAAALCTVVTDENGVATAGITGGTAGAVTLLATADAASGGASVTTNTEVRADVYSLSAIEAETYVAEGATFRLRLDAIASIAGDVAAAQAVQWSGNGGFTLAAEQTSTDGLGRTADDATVLPLAAGVRAVVLACAWTNICAEFDATGVSARAWRIDVVSGGAQIVTMGSVPRPLLARVTDGQGHAVAAASVSIYQVATEVNGACPDRGRCPAARVLATRATAMQSDGDGLIAVTPLQVQGSASDTSMAFSTGTQGFATAVLSTRPLP